MKEIVNYQITAIVSKIILWVGILIILLSVGYAIFNLSNIDNFITIWAILMAVGVCFCFIGILLGIYSKSSQKIHISSAN